MCFSNGGGSKSDPGPTERIIPAPEVPVASMAPSAQPSSPIATPQAKTTSRGTGLSIPTI